LILPLGEKEKNSLFLERSSRAVGAGDSVKAYYSCALGSADHTIMEDIIYLGETDSHFILLNPTLMLYIVY
jgi:hypothetical protein